MEYGRNTTERLTEAELLAATESVRLILGELNSLKDDLAKARVGEAVYSNAKNILQIGEALKINTLPKNGEAYTAEQEAAMQELASSVEVILTKDDRSDKEEEVYKAILGIIEFLYPNEAVKDLLFEIDKLSDIGERLMTINDITSILGQEDVVELEAAYSGVDKKITEIFCEITELERVENVVVKENLIVFQLANLPEDIQKEIQLDASYLGKSVKDNAKYIAKGISIEIDSGRLMFQGYPVTTKGQFDYVMKMLEIVSKIISRLEKNNTNPE